MKHTQQWDKNANLVVNRTAHYQPCCVRDVSLGICCSKLTKTKSLQGSFYYSVVRQQTYLFDAQIIMFDAEIMTSDAQIISI